MGGTLGGAAGDTRGGSPPPETVANLIVFLAEPPGSATRCASQRSQAAPWLSALPRIIELFVKGTILMVVAHYEELLQGVLTNAVGAARSR